MKHHILGLLLILLYLIPAEAISEYKFVSQNYFKKRVKKLIIENTDENPDALVPKLNMGTTIILKTFLEKLSTGNPLELDSEDTYRSEESNACKICHNFFKRVGLTLEDEKLLKQIHLLLKQALMPLFGVRGEFDEQLDGIMREMIDPILVHLSQKPLNPHKVCAFDLQLCSIPHYHVQPYPQHVANILNQNTLSLYNQSKLYPNDTPPIHSQSSIKALVISDVHIEPQYVIGSNSNCDFPVSKLYFFHFRSFLYSLLQRWL